MRKQLVGFLAASLVAAAAHATPIVEWNGSTNPVTGLVVGNNTITIEITPDQDKVAGYNLVFFISDTTKISLVSCAPAAGVSASCPAGGAFFSLGASLSQDATAKFTVGSFVINLPDLNLGSATLVLDITRATITTGLLDEPFVGGVVVPEPAVAGLLAVGLSGLALLGRKRVA